MHEIEFVQDLAEIMLTSGLITLLFHRLKQPVVLGYILAGIMIGPHTSFTPLVSNIKIIKIFAELGVIFLIFSLGLEFSLRNLNKVGISAFTAAVIEIIAMVLIGYEIGHMFHWSDINALFLGAMIAISSTTITVKAINELGLQKKDFVQLIFGILIIEDILAIAILVLLSGIATSDSVHTMDIVFTLGKLLLFLIASFVIGLLTVPRIISYVAKYNSHEMLLISVLGLCFGFCLLVVHFGYSIVLGAFVIGAIIAESNEVQVIEKLIEPLRDMFSAIFFVAIGLLLNPADLLTYWFPIIIITVAVIIGKVISCSFGTFITGEDGRTSLQVGMGLAQIGEFSFIIAALGISLKITGDFLYPIAVCVSALTTISTPYLIRVSNPLATKIKNIMPSRVAETFNIYTAWLQSIQNNDSKLRRTLRKNLYRIVINLAFIIIIFLSSARLAESNFLVNWGISNEKIFKTVMWGGALIIALPFLIVVYQKIKKISVELADFGVKENSLGGLTTPARKAISEVIPALSMLIIMLFISALSASILPPSELLIFVFIIAAILILFLWRFFVNLHARLQGILQDSMGKEK